MATFSRFELFSSGFIVWVDFSILSGKEKVNGTLEAIAKNDGLFNLIRMEAN